jgi:uncharacterized repeat protein (TIGR01451 family)
MKKKTLDFFKKVFTTFFLLVYSFTPSVQAIDDIASMDNSQDILEEGISDPSWIANGDVYTISSIVEGETYIAPQNSDVTVTFTKLPENPSTLSIREITLTDEEMEATGAVSDKAYDITTDMEDGTFEYDLTLPSTVNNANVVYAETREDIADNNVQEVENTIVDNGDTLKIEDLDHFTIYIVTGSVTLTTATVNNQTAVTVEPGENIEVELNVTISSDWSSNSWKSTGYKIGDGSWQCVDTSNYTGNGTHSDTFDIVAPTSEGIYNLTLKAYSGNGCSGWGSSSEYSMSNAITVEEASTTPTLSYDPNDPFAFTSISGIWIDTDGGQYITGLNTNEVRWGDPAGSQKSGLRFDGSGQQSFDSGETFYLGMLTHMNWGVYSGTAANGATLQITLDFEEPDVSDKVLTYDFEIEETLNQYGSCLWWQETSTPCDDMVTFPTIYGSESFQLGDKLYTLEIVGFVDSYPGGSPVSQFITEEQQNNTAYLVGRLSSVLVPEPQISLVEKAVNGDDADTAPGVVVGIGDDVDFTYNIQNTGNVQMTNITVYDDQGISVTCPQTTLEAGESMVCTGSSTAVAGQYTNTAYVTGVHEGTTYKSNDESANYYGIGTVTICHATSSQTNPYITNTPAATGDVSGHDNHDGPIWYYGITETWGDIIPPFTYPGGTYEGKNWDEYGQSIWNNGCSIPSATITVEKVVSPSNSNESFGITGTGTAAISGSGTFLDSDGTGTISRTHSETFSVAPGTYDFTETVPDGWTQVSNTCSDLTVANGADITCTITNTQYASLTIIKDANPNSDHVFNFTLSSSELSEDFTLVDDGSSSNTKEFNELMPDTYSITEEDIDGDEWDLTDVSCVDQNDEEIDNTSIVLSGGDDITCTFTNTQRGTISGHKYNDADGSDSTTGDRTGVDGWTIELWQNEIKLDETTTSGGGLYMFSNLEPGNYTVKEGVGSGWYVLYPTSMEINVTLDAGETDSGNDFINVQYGSIKITKIVDPSPSLATFTFGISTTGYFSGTTLGDGESYTFTNLKPGTYQISETINPNYFTTIVCDGVNGDPGSTGFMTGLESGEDIECTFTNTRKTGTLKVVKSLTNDNGGTLDEEDFSFKINGGSDEYFESDGINEYTVPTGTYTVVENSANGYTTTYNNCSNVEVTYNGVATCTISNDDIAPQLTVVKHVINNTNDSLLDASDFTINVAGTNVSDDSFDGSESGTTVTLDAGSYSVSEDYDSDDYTQSPSSNCSGTIALGEHKTCTITNTDIDHLPEIEVTKTADKTSVKETGEDVVFTFTVKNNSDEDVTIDSLSDTVFGTLDGDSSCEVGTVLSAGDSCQFSITRFISGDYSGSSHTNIFTAVAHDDEDNSTSDTDSETITFTDVLPDVEITKSVDHASLDEPGGDFTYTLKIENKSDEAVTIDDLTDTDTLSAECLALVGTSLAANSSVSCTYKVNHTEAGDYPDTATVYVSDDDTNTDWDDDSVTVSVVDVKPVIEVTKMATVSSIPETGQNVTFIFSVTNNSVENVRITSLEDSKFGTLSGNSFCQVGTVLTPGMVCSFSQTEFISGEFGYDHENTFTAQAEDNEDNTAEDSATETVEFTDVLPSVVITKTAGIHTLPEPGGDFLFTLTIKNTSLEKETIINLTDDYTLSSDCMNLINRELNPNEEVSCTYVVSKTNAGVYDNTAVVNVKDNEGNTSSDSDSEQISVTNVNPSIEVTKTADKMSVPETGENVTFTFTVRNTSVESVEITELIDSVFETLSGDSDCQVGTVLAVGDTCSFDYTTFISGDYGQNHENIFTAVAKDDEGNISVDTDDETVILTDVRPDITVTKTPNVDFIPESGGNVIYTYTVTNNTAEEVTITSLTDDKFPAIDGDADCQVGTILAGNESCTFDETVWIEGIAPDVHTNTFTAEVIDDERNTDTDSASADVTFTYVPSIKLVKVVDNSEYNGSAVASQWTLTASGDSKGFSDNGATGTYHFVTPGQEYTLSESSVSGYESLGWSCTGGVLDDDVLTLSAEDDVVCTITNKALPATLIVRKVLVKNNGGNESVTDFKFTVNGGSETPFESDGENVLTLSAGRYTVRESSVSGYRTTYSGCTNIQIANGETKTCTITNNDIAPTITLNKVVINDNGGRAGSNSFGLTIGGRTVRSGQTLNVNANEAISIDEAGLYGYKFESITGDSKCPGVLGGTVTLDEGENITCTITNNDIAPKLTLNKVVFNDNGGNEEESDWLLRAIGVFGTLQGYGAAGDNDVVSGSSFKAGTYILSESGASGYSSSGWSCVKNGGSAVQGSIISLGVGDSAVCTITNDDIAPTLTVVKVAVNNDGGNDTIDDFGITLNDDPLSFGLGLTIGSVTTYVSSQRVSSNVEYELDENELSGYDEGSWYCIDDHLHRVYNPFTLDEGQNVVCTIINNDIAPTLTVVKDVVNDNGGDATVNDFNIQMDDESLVFDSGTTNTDTKTTTYTSTPSVIANKTYSLSEDPLDGYVNGTWTCVDNDTHEIVSEDESISLGEGQNVTCTITNDDVAPKLTLIKEFEEGYEGTTLPDDFNLTVGGNTVLSGEENEYDANTEYVIDETQLDGFVFYSITGDGCPESLGDSITLDEGDDVTCTITNHVIDPVLQIAKENDTLGLDKSAGDNVVYTITVTAPEVEEDGGDYVIKNVKLMDILPAGFSFVSGSWTATKNGLAISLTEPLYGSTFAEWSLGDMKEGDVIVLSYTGNISATQDAGLYKDIAWVKGISLSGNTVLGNADTGIFVGTQVNVVENYIEEGQVLGITDHVTLPDTGADTILTLGAIFTMILGFLMVIFKSKKKYLFSLVAVSLLGLSFTSAHAQTIDKLLVDIEQPASPVNTQNFKIGFVVANTTGDPITVQCVEETYGVFDTYTGVNAGDCIVDSSVIPADGTYTFYIVASDSSHPASESDDHVVVVADFVKPSAVEDYEKTESGCSNVLTFKTADDGQTTKVQIFRSTNSSFTANSSTLIKELTVGPNENVTYTDDTAVCDVDYYYAVRALDTAGNTSDFVADKVVVYVEAEDTEETTGTGEVAGEETSNGEETEDTAEEDTNEEDNSETEDTNGEVKGETTDGSKTEESKGWSWWQYTILSAGVILLVYVIYTYVRNKRQRGTF